MRRIVLSVIIALWLSPALALTPRVQSIDPPKRILFVGNSFTFYNDGLHKHVGGLMRAAGIYRQVRMRALTLSGAKLHEHAGGMSYFTQDKSWDNWDLVVMHGHSQELLTQKSADFFAKVAKKYAERIRARGGDIALLMTWGYANNRKMIQPIQRNYTLIGNKLNALVIPVGIAFQQAQHDHPEINLYKKDLLRYSKKGGNISAVYKKNIKHPSVAGTYLAACVVYAALFDKSPLALPYTAGLPMRHARSLQQIAYNTVTIFYRRHEKKP